MHFRIRCPICGMLTYLRNLGKQHSLQIFRVDIGGKVPVGGKGCGRAKGKIIWEETDAIGDASIEEFWLSYLIDCSINLVKKGELEKDIDKIIQNKILELAFLVGLKKKVSIKPRIPIKLRGTYIIETKPYINIKPHITEDTKIIIYPKIKIDIKERR